MNYWINLSSPTNKYPELENGTLLLPYECPTCHQVVIAAGISTNNKYMISIAHYHYCPHCGKSIHYKDLNSPQNHDII